MFRRNARTGVLDLNLHHLGAIFALPGFRANGQGAVRLHRVECIEEQVHDHLLQLLTISMDCVWFRAILLSSRINFVLM